MKSSSPINKIIKIQFHIILLCLIIGFSGCGKPQEDMPKMLPEVGYVEVKSEKVVVTTELPGRTHAYLMAEVRPEVGGIIQKRFFEEGADVRENDVLYQIDSAPYKAIYEKCKADLARSEAQVVSSKLKYERNKSLVKGHAVSLQEYEIAESDYFSAEADIKACKAALESAKLNVDYTSVKAPISGRIGKSHVTVGSLVTANDPIPLATIQQINPIFVNAVQSSADLLKYKRDVESTYITKENDKGIKVKLFFEDGSAYDIEGELKFRDITVDQSTGSFILRMIFPNPEFSILPGMYVTVVIEEGVVNNGILIPHQALKRNFKGEAIVYLVGDSDKVDERKVVIDRSLGNKWLVRNGLKAGDKIIVEGFQRIRPGIRVKAVPFGAQKKDSAVGATQKGTKE